MKGDCRPSWDQEAGWRFGPWGSWMKARERQARHRVRRLKAVASTVHSAATLTRPRSRNLRAPLLLLDDSEDRLDQLLSQLVRLFSC